jgi:Mrp family chromosome partitioning ATPase/tetratricopeptide (TPR) repeat protein
MVADGMRGEIVTFYSFREHDGRTAALVNVAWALASAGKRVLVIDWDLAGPRVHDYFYPFLVDKELTSTTGVIDFVTDYTIAVLTPPAEGEEVSEHWYVPLADMMRHANSLECEFAEDGTLDFIPVGRQGLSYESSVNSFDWRNLFERFGGEGFLEAAKESVRDDYDYILINSPAGVDAAAAVCTVQMPDTVVFCLSSADAESEVAVATSIRTQRRNRKLRILPVLLNAKSSGPKAKPDGVKKIPHVLAEDVLSEQQEQYWSDVSVDTSASADKAVVAIFATSGTRRNAVVSFAERLASYISRQDVQPNYSLSKAKRRSVVEQYRFRRSPTRLQGERSTKSRKKDERAVASVVVATDSREMHRDDYTVLKAASLFPAGAARPAFEKVTGLPIGRLDAALGRLTARQLVVPRREGKRFSVTRAAQDALGVPAPKDRAADDMRRRLIRFFAVYVESHPRVTSADFDALEEERDNILLAIDLAVASGDWESVMQMARIIGRESNGVLVVRGHWDEALWCCEQAVKASETVDNTEMGAILSECMAGIHIERGNYEEAGAILNRNLKVFTQSNNEEHHALTVKTQGTMEYHLSRWGKARELYEEGLLIYRKLGLREGVASSIHNLAVIAHERGDIAEARRLYEESLAISREVGAKLGEADSLHQLGVVEGTLGYRAKAERYLREAIAIYTALDSPRITIAQQSLHRLESGPTGTFVFRRGAKDVEVEFLSRREGKRET